MLSNTQTNLHSGHSQLTIKKDSLYKLLFFSFLFIGYLNATLRPNLESNITLFRVLLPVFFLFSFVLFKTTMIKCVIVIFIFFIYGVFTAMVMSSFENFNVVYFLHYSTLIFLAFLTFAMIRRFGIHSLYTHLKLVYVLMIALAILQFFYPYELPNTLYRLTLNIYYWVENDFSTALAAFIPFLLVDRNKKILNWILAFLGVLIIIYNSSRIALLSILFFVIFKLLNRFGWAGYTLSAIAVFFLFIIFKDYKLEGNSIYQMLVDPFGHIFSLTTYSQVGSIFDRTNALIFGLIELIKSYGFGIGPGNGTLLFEQPEYYLVTAQSMHNFVAQIIVEYGWLMLIALAYFIVKSYNIRRRLDIRVKDDRLLYIYFVTMSLASLTQSEGLFSNYYFFVSVFASVAYFGNYEIKGSVVDESE